MTEGLACADDGVVACVYAYMRIFNSVIPANKIQSSRPIKYSHPGLRAGISHLPVIPEDTKYLSGISQTVWLRLNSFIRRSPLRSMRG